MRSILHAIAFGSPGMTLVRRSVSFCRFFEPDRPERSGGEGNPWLGTSRPFPPCGEESRSRSLNPRPYFAVQPPSIDRFAPVIWPAASEQRKTASAAT